MRHGEARPALTKRRVGDCSIPELPTQVFAAVYLTANMSWWLQGRRRIVLAGIGNSHGIRGLRD